MTIQSVTTIVANGPSAQEFDVSQNGFEAEHENIPELAMYSH